MASRTDSRSSFLVQTKIGPLKSSGTESPLFTTKSSPLPMSCRALPTLPPPTITAGVTLVLMAVPMAMVLALLDLIWTPKVRLEMGFARRERERREELGSVIAFAMDESFKGDGYWRHCGVFERISLMVQR